MLQFHPVQEHAVPPTRWAQLLAEFRTTLVDQGMASMDEYGDMLNWGLPRADGWSRSLHVFHPGFCSFSDAHRGTIHFHGGRIRGTILAGEMEHITYRPHQTPDGDRFLGDEAYRLEPHTRRHGEGTRYGLPAHVAHWLRPTRLTLTYFEEEDNGEMGDLVDPADAGPDEHVWEQEDAEALMPELLAAIDARLERLTLTASP